MIVYAGSLVNPALLDYAPQGCEVYDSAFMTLDEVMEKLLDGERRGLTTVRLHTGDPSLYGAIREQMDRLRAEGVEFSVVPGVIIVHRIEYQSPEAAVRIARRRRDIVDDLLEQLCDTRPFLCRNKRRI